MHVTFASGALTLEGDLTLPTGATRAAVICHPHPQYGGDMNNSVVRALARVLEDTGHATLRFNFRGVGASEGAYAGGVGEAQDAQAAVSCVRERAGVQAVTLAGYSFGAMVALQAGAHLPAVDRLIAVAPPLSFFDLAGLAACTKEKLFIVGDSDQYCGVAQLTQQLARVAEPKAQRIVCGADHFFFGHEAALIEAVRSCTLTPRQAGASTQ
jgi:alpha/beta superfamily hydrolase